MRRPWIQVLSTLLIVTGASGARAQTSPQVDCSLANSPDLTLGMTGLQFDSSSAGHHSSPGALNRTEGDATRHSVVIATALQANFTALFQAQAAGTEISACTIPISAEVFIKVQTVKITGIELSEKVSDLDNAHHAPPSMAVTLSYEYASVSQGPPSLQPNQ